MNSSSPFSNSTSAIKNKTVFCLLIITLFTSFFFARSVVVRERWIVPTFMAQQNFYQQHIDVTARSLDSINNWLKEGIFNIRFGLYIYPASVEMPTLDKRSFYGSYPPMSIFPIYLLFKTLEISGVVPNIYEKRGLQLLLLTIYSYCIHFLLALVLCFLVFFLCLKLGFDRLNSTLLAIVPTIVQFHNANSLFHHHAIYNMDQAVLLPFALYVFLEFLRIAYASPRVLRFVKVLQPLLMFWGVLIDWLFGFLIVVVYATRLVRKEINSPLSPQQVLPWVKQSLLFFAPAITAVGLWIYQIAHYLQNITKGSLSTTAITAHDHTLFEKILIRTGLADGIDHYLHYLKIAFITHIQSGYGIIGMILIYATLWTASRGRKFMNKDDDSISQAAFIYLIFSLSSIAYNLVFLQHSYDHIYSSLKFSLPLSIAFVFLPIFILQIARKSHLLPAIRIFYARNISLAAVIAVSSSLLYGYSQIYDKLSITKMFSQPDLKYAAIGSFVKENISYRDVVFSDFYPVQSSFSTLRLHFANKVTHYAYNLDHVYHKTKSITQDFTIKILYREGSTIKSLRSFLDSQNIFVTDNQEELLGLLAFDGKEFIAWYERIHECDVYPQRCEEADLISDQD